METVLSLQVLLRVLHSSAAIAKRYQVFSKAMELRCLLMNTEALVAVWNLSPLVSLSYPMGFMEAIDDSVDDCEAYDVTEPLSTNYFVLAALEVR